VTPGGFVYHVCNRGASKGRLFDCDDDYAAFETLLTRAREKRPMRIIAYELMSTHIHLLLWPKGDRDVPRFMQWLTGKHAQDWHLRRGTTGSGAVYQSRYTSVGIAEIAHLINAWRYVERNALAAGLVRRAEDWRWSSLWQTRAERPTFMLDPGPICLPANWLDILNDLNDQ
jgi:putative transposase